MTYGFHFSWLFDEQQLQAKKGTELCISRWELTFLDTHLRFCRIKRKSCEFGIISRVKKCVRVLRVWNLETNARRSFSGRTI
jgi:hypothetical protein